MNSITMNGMARPSGQWFPSMQDLMKRSDGSRGMTSFGDALREASDARKTGAAQSRDTYEPETISRTRLSSGDLAELSGRYDPHNMTQDQYDAFLDELMEKGALSRMDAARLGYHGLRVLDMEPDENGKVHNGWAYVVSLDANGNPIRPIESLEDAGGDLFRWLDAMLDRQEQGIGASRRQKEALDTLYDIVKRM